MISIFEAEEILKKEYSQDNFVFLLDKILLPDYQKDNRAVSFSSTLFESIEQLGFSSQCDVTIFEINLKKGAERKRVAITQEAFRMLRSFRINNAVISFVNKNLLNYRISLLTSKYEYDGEKITKVTSNPKRYSYSLGYGTKTKTAYKFLISKGTVDSLEDLISRFSVEVVNKHFYLQIATLFTQLVGGERNSHTYERQLELKNVKEDSKYAEFAVRLIGRIMFCWFLREKRSDNGIPLVPDSYFGVGIINFYDSYYHSVLEPLFFEMLNTNQKRRKPEYKTDEYNSIPYLNGGLFSPHADDLYRYDPVTKLGKLENVMIPNQWFSDLFAVLSEYNFTVDENTSYDIELSIDPEMLGRIFENLLAEINPETGENAKKNTGSFYTPREIVDYMVDNSLCEFLHSKTKIESNRLSALISYSKDDDELTNFNDEEIKKIIDALYQITVLDPACGSGAFPIGMLQKIVYVLQEIDPSAKLWLTKSTENISPLLRKEIENKFSVGSLNYIRKLSVIQNSIFGIDIQPIAVEISRLRCFLSLIIEEKVEDDQTNRGINPLPNLDFKFIIANSLVGLDGSRQMSLGEDSDHIYQLKEVRDEYFNADSESRAELKVSFQNIQQDMLLTNIASGFVSEKYSQLSAWKPFDNKPTSWFDADWMFGIKDGFDIVIGNPPYIDSETMTKTMKDQREEYSKQYEVAKGNWDIFLLFIEMAIKHIKYEGNTTFILPNKLIAANYAKATRKYMSKYSFVSLRDYSDVAVFEASVYPVVYLLSKSNNYDTCLIQKMNSIDGVLFEKHIKQSIFSESENWDSFFQEKTIASDIVNKMNKFEPIGNFAFVKGSATVGEAYDVQPFLKNSDGREKETFKFVNTGTIDRYVITWGEDKTQYLKQLYFKPIISEKDLLNVLPNRYEDAAKEKIIIGGMCKTLECYYDNGECLAGKSTTIITDSDISLKCLTGILNSKLLTYFYSVYFSSLSLQGGFLRVGPPQIKLLPIPIKTIKSSGIDAVLESYVDKRIQNQNNQDECIRLEKAINKIVYALYELSPDEVEEVEKFMA